MVNVTKADINLDHAYACLVLDKVLKIIEPLNDPEQIKGVVETVRGGLAELAASKEGDEEGGFQ